MIHTLIEGKEIILHADGTIEERAKGVFIKKEQTHVNGYEVYK